MTYFIVIRNNHSVSEGQKSKFLDKLQYLENGISNEIDRRDKLLKTISTILKSTNANEVDNDLPTTSLVFLEENLDVLPKEDGSLRQNFDTVKSNFKLNRSDGTPVIAVLLMACNRVCKIFSKIY